MKISFYSHILIEAMYREFYAALLPVRTVLTIGVFDQ
jgi:hypothetical protein